MSSAPIELDHVFILTSPGAPEAGRLIEAGFVEGPPNTHPGQGTACRRFSFLNAMLEFLWVDDPVDAQSQRTSRTRLWDRWTHRDSGASPFGICTRPAIPGTTGAPFPAWDYHPAYLPPDLCLYIGTAGTDEPLWVHIDFVAREHRTQRFVAHPNGAREITEVRLTSPVTPRLEAIHAVTTVEPGAAHLLAVEFDHAIHRKHLDLRPELPLLLEL